MIYIGIDTGVHTGVGIWDSKKREFTLVKTMKIHQAMDLVKEKAEEAKAGTIELMVRVEDPRKRTWFGTERMPREDERKRLQGVGSVKRDAVIWEDYLTDLGVDFDMVHPKQSITKLSQQNFKDITGWNGRTNEHCRDAAMLVFGF